MKKSGRKLLGMLLAASLAVTAIAPMQGMAANQEERGHEATAQKKESKEEVLEKALEQEKQPVAEEEGAEGKSLRNVQAEEEGAPKEELQEKVQTGEGSKMEQFLAPEETGEETQTPAEGSYDINQPVIESFELEENGKTLTVNDTLHFRMKAYDADSGIASNYFYISCSDPYGSNEYVTLEKNQEEENLYTAEVPCSQLNGNNFYISSIQIIDNANNYVYGETSGEDGYLYTFTLDMEVEVEDIPISVTNFQMETNPSNEDGNLRVNDTVTYTADVTCNNEEIRDASMYIDTYTNSSWHSGYADMEYNPDTKKLTGTYTVTERTYPGEWELDYIRVSTESGKYYYFYPSSIEPDADLKFTVVQEGYDTEKPVIESITLDKNKEFVRAGDVVTLRVKVREEHPSQSAYAYFYPQVNYVSDSEYVSLELNEATMEYTGTIEITEDTYPCEWALEQLDISDTVGNTTGLYDFQNDWRSTYPWYYKVKSGEQYREDVKDITFEIYGFAKDEDGSFQTGYLISTVEKKVGRRDTLKGLNLPLPEPPAENVSITGWKKWYWDETTITEDTEIFFGNSSGTYSLTAVYDKGCANVSLTYMADSGVKTAMVPIFVDKETTYKDVLELLELPEDAVKDDFARFELDSYYEETAQVGDASYIYVEAEYKNCQVAWNARYLGQDGKEASNVTTKSYLEGTSFGDALAELPVPEEMEGLEFDKWVLVGSEADGVINQPMASLDVVAVYKGKTTVDATYCYRGEDGAVADGSRMALMEGEALTDAEVEGAATEAFKDVAHYKGLVLSEWTGSISVNQERYKKVQFQALYTNCVAILKYPDGSVQSVVVDKGSKFQLPTEHEEYLEIIWKGFAKGEAVEIEADKEFVVEDYKLKEDLPLEPEGAKLPEDEIAKITEEIKNAEAGAAIKVDMKKATIVPKEVLEAIQGKPVDIVLDMGGYSWTIGGTEVLASNLKDIDLEVKVGADVIPSSLVSSIAEGKPTTQLSLTHNGDFGFRADLSLNLGSENAGGTGSLYYYDSSGKLIFMNAGKIGADGNTVLSFSHASDYVIVVEKATPPTNEKEEDTDKKEDDSNKEDNAGKEEDTSKEDNTGKEEDTNKEDNTGKEEDTSKEDNTGKEDGANQNGEGEKEEEGTEENAGSKDNRKEDDGIANIKRKDNNTTTDTGKAPANTAGTAGNASTGKMKSPKTGE